MGSFTWIDQMMLCGGRFGLIEGGALQGYGPGGAQGFVEKCGWDDVVDGFEVREIDNGEDLHHTWHTP